MLPGANCTWWFKWTNVRLSVEYKSCIEDWTTEEATENNKTPELRARAFHSSAHNTGQIESLLLCPRLLCCLWLQQLQLVNEDNDEGERWNPILFLSLWNRWLWRLETAAAMVEHFGGVLGLNLLCLAWLRWIGVRRRCEDNSKKKSSHGVFNLLVRDRGHSGATLDTQSECLGRKGGKDWYFIWGGSYMHSIGRRGVNVY